MSDNRRNIHTRIDKDLYLEIQMLALKEGLKANDLIEEGLKLVLEKRKEKERQNEKG